jgi:hypothetical protein
MQSIVMEQENDERVKVFCSKKMRGSGCDLLKDQMSFADQHRSGAHDSKQIKRIAGFHRK